MDMEIGECVGICETDDKGHIIKIEREYFQQGWIFKEELFVQLDWQSPSTLFNEWEDMGEIEACEECGKLLLVFGLEKCPYCGRNTRGE